MALNGFERPCRKIGGGVVEVLLVRAEDFNGATYDASVDSFTELSLIGEAASYSFREGEASYSEEIVRASAAEPLVRHILAFTLAGMNTPSRRAVEELASTSTRGLIALVTTRDNERLLVGYSPKFGTEQPLRLTRATGSTAQAYWEIPTETIHFVSEDSGKSKPFIGVMP
jgi:hypothetical protein